MTQEISHCGTLELEMYVRYDREAHVWIKLTIAVFERYRGTELAFARKLEAG